MAVPPNEKPIIFVQFAGQGAKYIDELRQLYSTCPAIRPFIQDAIAEIKKQASCYDDTQTAFFPHGLEVDRWLEDKSETPDSGYLLSSPLSHPLIYLCQISNYISILHDGLDQEKLLLNTHSMTGFSTGVVAAILCSMGLPLDELQKLAIKVLSMFFWQGIRTQQCILKLGIRPKLVPGQFNSTEETPSCMANISGLTRDRLEELINSFSSYGIVYPAYELLPDRWVVSGMPDVLVEFNKFLYERIDGVGWKYNLSTIAAHSPFLSDALESTPLDVEQLDFDFNTEEMKVPVWSNDTGTDLRISKDVLYDVMQAYFIRPGVWRKQIAPLFPPTCITHVLDFGPGSGMASLTQSHIKESGIQVIRCALPNGRKKLFEEVLPALDHP
ncbi:hypothetical protein ACFLXA_04315 [Chloroflexota bacterium]